MQSKIEAARRCRGLGAIEVLVIIAVLGFFVLVVLAALPRRREYARLAGCQRNLGQIGAACALYDQQAGHLPEIPKLNEDTSMPAPGPLRVLLESLALPDFAAIADTKGRPDPRPGMAIVERPVRGFVCASDPNAIAGLFPAPISYRATTGDSPEGRNGVFAPGRRSGLAAIEAGKGTGYAAAFSERLVGNARPAPSPNNYAVAPGPVGGPDCPSPDPSAWRGDAGASWTVANWRSTLYNHALTPGAAPSCLAGDGGTALMGASSGHPGGVNVLLLDGAVRTYTPRVDPAIWRGLARSTGP